MTGKEKQTLKEIFGDAVSVNTRVKDGVLIDPMLPNEFDNTPNPLRPSSHEKWWGMFATLEEALLCAKSGPQWRREAYVPTGLQVELQEQVDGVSLRPSTQPERKTMETRITSQEVLAQINALNAAIKNDETGDALCDDLAVMPEVAEAATELARVTRLVAGLSPLVEDDPTKQAIEDFYSALGR